MSNKTKIKSCPKCDSQDIMVGKTETMFKCKSCGLALGPFSSPEVLLKAVKLWRKKTQTLKENKDGK